MPKIDDRYELISALGEGSQASTHLAARIADGRHLVLKELRFERLDSWKSLELFEREADVLRELHHPQVPEFVEAFQFEQEQTRYFLAQEFIEGPSLRDELDRGVRWDEDELRRFAQSMLGVLSYIHRRVPPVVHRDIKPANVIVRDHDFVLVDFGGAQVVIADDTGGSTVVGTSGYMPPEQLAGRAQPASDLYALGATLVHIVTGVHPSELPTARLKLDWKGQSRLELSEDLEAIIDRLLAPMMEDRFSSADDVLDALCGDVPVAVKEKPSAKQALAEFGLNTHLWRVVRHGHCVVFDFGTSSGHWRKTKGSAVGGVLFFVGLLIFLGVGPWGIVLMMGGAFGLSANEPKDSELERLTIYQGGRYLLERREQGTTEIREQRGTVRDAKLGPKFLAVETGDGVVFLGQQLSHRIRQWLSDELDAEIASGRLDALPERAPQRDQSAVLN